MSGVGALPICPNAVLGTSVAATVAKAGSGDLEAQRNLFQDRIGIALNPEVPAANAVLVSIEAVLFGRLIASHGHAVDNRWLAASLCQASTLCEKVGRTDLGGPLMVEAVSILEQLAECGDDLAAISSYTLIQGLPADFVDHVRALRAFSSQEGAE